MVPDLIVSPSDVEVGVYSGACVFNVSVPTEGVSGRVLFTGEAFRENLQAVNQHNR